MKNLAKWIGTAAVAALAVGTFGLPRADAQFRAGPTIGLAGPGMLPNPNFFVRPGLTLNQWALNTQVIGRGLSGIPPYWLGYNPYPQMVNYGPMYNPIPPLYSPTINPLMSPVANPYINPYAALSTVGAGGYGGYGSPASLTSAAGLPTSAAYGGYGSGYTSPYTPSYDPNSGFLRGAADVINSQGNLVNQLEQAKVIKEQAKQAAIDTRRKLFDEIMYERAHTPSWTEEQEKLGQLLLRRAQNTAGINEIWSARSLNTLLDDLAKIQGKKAGDLPDIKLDTDVLKQINVQGGKGTGNIGILRNEGRLSWPIGVRNLEPADDAKDLRSALETKARAAIQQAANGPVNAGVLKDLRFNLDKLQRMLTKNVRKLPTDQYIEAKRYLNNFEDALKALQGDNVANYFNKNWVAQGETVKDLVNYMVKKGLRFAPATSGDEAAYQALHNALAAYSVAARQAVASSREEKD